MSQVRRDVFGPMPDGAAVERIRLGHAPGPVVEVLTLGAAVHRLEVRDRAGERRNVVLGYSTVDDYLGGRDYLGATVGRYANRIAGASFALGGVQYRLGANDRGNNLHGGPEGFDRQLWDVVDGDDASVVLEFVSPDGDQGFPGTLTTRVRFVVDGDEVRIEYTATTDAPTLANFSSHVYWNLDGEGRSAIDGHRLTVPADRYTPIGATGIPEGEHRDVAGTAFDFRSPRTLASAIDADDAQIRSAGGIDHNLVVVGDGLREVAVLSSPVSGIELRLSSDRPGLQVYTGGGFDGSFRGTSGQPYQRNAGIALEPQFFPDSPHHSQWPSAVLQPGETYGSVTQMRLQAPGSG